MINHMPKLEKANRNRNLVGLQIWIPMYTFRNTPQLWLDVPSHNVFDPALPHTALVVRTPEPDEIAASYTLLTTYVDIIKWRK